MPSTISAPSTVISLEEQLHNEMRICPQCRCEITNPFITRCPRCLTAVPRQEPGCGSCAHRNSCPVIP